MENALSPTQLIIAIVLLVLLTYSSLAVFAYKAGKSQDTIKLVSALQFSLGIPLLLGPVVYPWYLMSLVPVLVLAPRLWVLTWMALLPFTYEVLSLWLAYEQWRPATWPIILVGLGLFLAFCYPIYVSISSKFSTSMISSTKRSEAN